MDGLTDIAQKLNTPIYMKFSCKGPFSFRAVFTMAGLQTTAFTINSQAFSSEELKLYGFTMSSFHRVNKKLSQNYHQHSSFQGCHLSSTSRFPDFSLIFSLTFYSFPYLLTDKKAFTVKPRLFEVSGTARFSSNYR